MENDEHDRDADEAWPDEGIFEAVPYEPDWISEIEDHGLLPIHPSQLDPLTALEEPLRLGWITEQVADLGAEQQAELMGPHVAQWRRFYRFQSEVARIEDERTRLIGDERDNVTRQWRDEQHEFDSFKRSPEFQAALRFRLEKERPIFERVMERPESDPTRNIAETRRHQMEALLVDSHDDEPRPSEDAGGADCAGSDLASTSLSVTEALHEQPMLDRVPVPDVPPLEFERDPAFQKQGGAPGNTSAVPEQPEKWIGRAREYAADIWLRMLNNNQPPSKEGIAPEIACRLQRDDKLVTRRGKRITPDYIVRFALSPTENGGWQPPVSD